MLYFLEGLKFSLLSTIFTSTNWDFMVKEEKCIIINVNKVHVQEKKRTWIIKTYGWLDILKECFIANNLDLNYNMCI